MEEVVVRGNIDTPKHQGWGRLLTRHGWSKIKHDVNGRVGITLGWRKVMTNVYVPLAYHHANTIETILVIICKDIIIK